MGEPIHVYPDPNGGANSANYVPSDTRLAGGSIVSGGAAVITAAAGSGTAPDQGLLLFFQDVAQRGVGGAFLGIHAASGRYVALFLFFASLSVVLATINLVKGIKMKRDLLALSTRVNEACKTGPPTPPIFAWWKSSK